MKLTVRTTTGTSCDIECDPTIKISELKKLIESEHELKPEPADQRLVCAGKLGKDDQTVKSFIETSTVIHMIYSGSNKTKGEKEKEAEEKKKLAKAALEAEKIKAAAAETAGKLGANKCRRRCTKNDAIQNKLRDEVRDFMAWKGLEKHPYLNITVEKSLLKRRTFEKSGKPENGASKPDLNNNVTDTEKIATDTVDVSENAAENQENAAENLEQAADNPAANLIPEQPAVAAPPAAAPAVAEDEGFRIDWFDRIFYAIQMSFFGLMIFSRTAMGSWWIFGAIALALLFVKLFVQGFFNPRRQGAETPAPNAAPVDPNRPVPFGRVILTFFMSFFRSLIPEALPAGVQFG
jgi:hypothetical protein